MHLSLHRVITLEGEQLHPSTIFTLGDDLTNPSLNLFSIQPTLHSPHDLRYAPALHFLMNLTPKHSLGIFYICKTKAII